MIRDSLEKITTCVALVRPYSSYCAIVDIYRSNESGIADVYFRHVSRNMMKKALSYDDWKIRWKDHALDVLYIGAIFDDQLVATVRVPDGTFDPPQEPKRQELGFCAATSSPPVFDPMTGISDADPAVDAYNCFG